MSTDYPEKTCTTDRLVRHPKLVAAAIAGTKTQQRRDGIYAYPNETFELEGIPFIVTAVERQRLGDMSDADASRRLSEPRHVQTDYFTDARQYDVG